MPCENLVGNRFGMLTVMNMLAPIRTKRGTAGSCLCLCDCGEWTTVLSQSLKRGAQVSCGCRKRKHAEGYRRDLPSQKTPEYIAWKSMRGRCLNPNNGKFPHYGGRGITICKKWDEYEEFLADMGRKPSPAHSLDRIDVNGDYEPGNVRWATAKEQSRNLRTNRLVTVGGVTRKLFEWADESGIDGDRISQRIKDGWSPERAISTPVKRRAS